MFAPYMLLDLIITVLNIRFLRLAVLPETQFVRLLSCVGVRIGCRRETFIVRCACVDAVWVAIVRCKAKLAVHP